MTNPRVQLLTEAADDCIEYANCLLEQAPNMGRTKEAHYRRQAADCEARARELRDWATELQAEQDEPKAGLPKAVELPASDDKRFEALPIFADYEGLRALSPVRILAMFDSLREALERIREKSMSFISKDGIEITKIAKAALANEMGDYRYENAGNPTDGQIMDQLEAAFEKMNDGYVCMDMTLRKRLAITLSEFMQPAVNRGGSHG